MTQLEQLITSYEQAQKELDYLTELQNERKAEIIQLMNEANEKEHIIDNIKATVVTKETFKYTDEVAMIKYLKENGLNQFIIEKIDTTPMNKELKKGLSLTESLKQMYIKNTTYSLSVKSL